MTTSHEAYFTLSEMKKLVIRKENMRRNKIPNRNFPVLTARQKREYPSVHPDFGLKSSKVYIFNCSVFAFDTILSKLLINVQSNG